LFLWALYFLTAPNLCDELDLAITEETPKYTTIWLIVTSPTPNVFRFRVLGIEHEVRRRVLPINISCYVLGARNLCPRWG
jgi:hypothetical protein